MPKHSTPTADHDLSQQQPLRNHLLELLGGGHAHLDFDSAIADGGKPKGQPHTPWRLLGAWKE